MNHFFFRTKKQNKTVKGYKEGKVGGEHDIYMRDTDEVKYENAEKNETEKIKMQYLV